MKLSRHHTAPLPARSIRKSSTVAIGKDVRRSLNKDSHGVRITLSPLNRQTRLLCYQDLTTPHDGLKRVLKLHLASSKLRDIPVEFLRAMGF
jgi:hypothetical protein